MLEKYKTVYEGGEGEMVEKKSRFIATVRPVSTEEEALAFIEEMKKKYWDARHNCYVYSVGKNREYTRCSDDGEPSGTAGRPMLDVILGEDIYIRRCSSNSFWIFACSLCSALAAFNSSFSCCFFV